MTRARTQNNVRCRLSNHCLSSPGSHGKSSLTIGEMIIKLYALLIDTADTRLFKIPKVVICAEFFIQRSVVDSLVY